jgi:hypothetical protein
MSLRGVVFGFALVALFATTSAPLVAQWPLWMPSGVPVTAEGKPDFNAPPPRTADGKPNLSGVWGAVPPPRADTAPPGAAAAPGTPPVGGTPAPPGAAPGSPAGSSASVFGNIGAQIPGGAPYQPWAAELVKQRMADNSKDNPDAHCLPMGVMQMTAHPFPRKIIQTPAEVVMIYEASGTTVREIFLDGRSLPPADAQPWWNGYSIGRWEGDTLVVETAGFLDDGWLDVRGSPLTSAGRLIERYRRPTYGSLEIDVTIDDPKAYTKPFTAKVNNRLLVDSQLIEFVCLDKDAAHYVGAEYKK